MKRLYVLLSLILLLSLLALPAVARAGDSPSPDGWTWDEAAMGTDGWTWDEL